MNATNIQIKILVVDDDFLGRNLVGRFLSLQGFKTTLSASGEDALQKLDQERFHLVVCNVDMPGMNGIQLLRSITVRHPHLPMILMTTFFDERLRELVLAWGAADLLRKPLVAGQLSAAVASVLHRGNEVAKTDVLKEAHTALAA